MALVSPPCLLEGPASLRRSMTDSSNVTAFVAARDSNEHQAALERGFTQHEMLSFRLLLANYCEIAASSDRGTKLFLGH
jgi:hypothetical protein